MHETVEGPVDRWRDSFKLLGCELPLIDDIYRRRLLPLADGTTRPLDVYVPQEEGDFLYSLVRHLRPSLTVEVGMANGMSTLFIAQALEDNQAGRHIAIDPFQFSDWGGVGISLIRKAGLESRVDLVEKPSHQALPELEQAGLKAQLIFIDGSHLFDYVIADFLCADRLLDVGGVIAFDDSDWPAVNQAIRYVLANRRYEAAHPDVVIEQPRGRPTLAGELLRFTGRISSQLRSKLRPEFLASSERLGISGRCVVLRKLGHDDRDSQSRFHHAF